METREIRTPLLDGGARGFQTSAKKPVGNSDDVVCKPLFPGLSCGPAPMTMSEEKSAGPQSSKENCRQFNLAGI